MSLGLAFGTNLLRKWEWEQRAVMGIGWDGNRNEIVRIEGNENH